MRYLPQRVVPADKCGLNASSVRTLLRPLTPAAFFGAVPPMKFHAALASVLATLAVSVGAHALEWHAAPTNVAFRGAPRDVARAYVVAYRADLGLASVELAPGAVLPGRGATTVRFAQAYKDRKSVV